jgi:hypothetical protein
MESSRLESDALAAAAERRNELKDSVSSLERAIAAPSAMPSWRDYVRGELENLQRALVRHVVEVEGEDGLFAELMETAPRLAHKIEQVQNEHPMLARMVEGSIGVLDETDNSETIRDSILETLFAVVRHRQRGADLVFEGYNVDIGGG